RGADEPAPAPGPPAAPRTPVAEPDPVGDPDPTPADRWAWRLTAARSGVPASPRLDPRTPALARDPRTPGAVPARRTPAVTVQPPPSVAFVGDGPPTYDAEPTALPPADPADLADLVPDTVLDGARYGPLTLRAASLRGDSARYRGQPRRDALLTARFGTRESALVLVALASGVRAADGAHRAARELCEWIGAAVGRSHARLSEDIRGGDRGALKSGLHRLTSRGFGQMRARAARQGVDPGEYTAALRCLLLPADPACRIRVFFGVGGGGLLRLRDGVWQDLEPAPREPGDPQGAPASGHGGEDGAAPGAWGPAAGAGPDTGSPAAYDPFLFRASVARPGDTLLLCSAGLAEPLLEEPGLAAHLARRWSGAEPPGLAAFLADVQTRVKGYADDRTAVAVWEE
ncbi:protein phosphatase 2C domain-containing protein, partial [Streptomyces sp. B1866]|uniref:protein phosphatase 2C domain-containing protein n=1 Tax=Streptomyces sp. B1866 TaxID=3075431 RepID=UPI00288F97F7